jgi:beta-glucosidase
MSGRRARRADAGIDIELPSTLCYGEPLLDEIEAGRVDESLVDRALR